MLLILLIVSIFLFLYPLTVYPLLIALLARLFPEPVKKSAPSKWPMVSLIVPAHNEEAFIGEKIANSLGLSYPHELIEILVVSDGSTDRTLEIARTFSGPRIRILEFPLRRGKLPAITEAVSLARGEVIVFSDASSILAPDAIERLTENFSDPTVGCVSGRYLIREDLTPVKDGRSSGERGYFEFEVFQRRQESLFHSTLGAHGALYAILRKEFPTLPAGVINDDFVIPMLVLSRGLRTVYEDQAIVAERHQTDVKGEFRRRIRISHGNFQQIFFLLPILGFRDFRVFFVFWSHKVIRAFQPLYLGAILLIPLFLKGSLYGLFFDLQAAFYLLGLFSLLFKKPRKIFAIPLYFVMGNAAILGGFLRQIRQGRQRAILQWEKS
ncbi:MAG: glycosyltransferase family 2 protein [Leptospirales bacterium]